MTTEHQYLPFLIDIKDVARVWSVTPTHVNQMIATGTFPIPSCRLSERVVRFKRADVEAYFGAPLSEITPWLIDEKEPA